MIYYVSTNGNDNALGTKESPFRTINHAAQIAVAGDTVRVFGGVYREWVDPRNSGEENARIIYEAVEGENPIIKGSEIITDWERVEGTVWKKVLPNTFFGDFNPYKKMLEGDWLTSPRKKIHVGDVYINGKSMYEAHTYADMVRAEKRIIWEQNGWKSNRTEYVLEPEKTVYQWYAEVDDENTTIWCNFQEFDPNKETIEINVRQSCFYPSKSGVNYITLRGFEIAQAACPFTPPTADQIGMVGAHWSKGWIIENNIMHDAKCSAISIGKDAATGDNNSLRTGRKSGHRYQAEAVFLGLRMGWNKETVGSHIIRNNVIYDCGQNGIVGHMGCAFCIIEHNEIYNIAMKREFWGHEIGGIKFHAPIDTVIENNNIHHCMLGTWLDWQSQGLRLTKNVYHHNDRDLMIEVTHGPCTVDNNLFLSEFSLDNHAQGTAYVHNVFAGGARLIKVHDRATPYHFPHTTEVAGYLPVYGGDDRIYNNMMLGVNEGCGSGHRPVGNLGSNYNAYYTPEEYPLAPGKNAYSVGNALFIKESQPVWIEGNAYSGYAFPYRAEKYAAVASGMTADVEENNGEWVLTINVPEAVVTASCTPVTTERLGTPRVTEEPYENADGTPIDFTVDYLGNIRTQDVIPGPFATLCEGENKFVVWKK
ncbi:MAG: DUF1565 domain-containing protein [Ruminococcaceae bacterium]|nr:DUF1565 domain-containing protein [Oscillospiraceae bacterium]